METTETTQSVEDFTVSDIMFIAGTGLFVCVILGYVFYCIKRTFRKVNLKFGNKLELGIETKDELKE